MLTAAKEGTFSASSDPCVFFPLAPSEGVPKNSRLGFARKNPAPHQGSAWSNSRKALGIEEVVWEICGGSDDSARYYDPTVGRFMSEDTTGFKGGVNFYPYVTNDPANQTDPVGLDSDSQRCRYLREKIANLEESITKRQRDLQDDPKGLPGSCPATDKIKPSLSRAGHQILINMDKARLAAYVAEYAWRCKDWPPIPPIPVPVLTPQQQQQLTNNTPAVVVVGVGMIIVVALSPVGL